MIKVSVVVATYRPDSGLERVVNSLDRQSLSQQEFEVLYVDDGSGEETLARLDAIATSRPNSSVVTLPHSGWPSASRNAGIERASGEYVLFMDHDDELYPDALRAAYELGHRNGADAVDGKETRTDQADWALATYTETMDNAVGRKDVHPLLPMNPHKLYRRELLIEHGIRFPEGDGGRVMWEDIDFNVQVARWARCISVLADVPFYHWVAVKGSSSTGFQRDNPEFWDALERVFTTIETELAGDRHTLQREQLISHQYAGRLLGSLGHAWAQRPEDERRLIFERCRDLIERHVPERFDSSLDPLRRLVAALVRQGRFAELTEFRRADPAVTGRAAVDTLRWTAEGALEVVTTTLWHDAEDRPLQLHRNGARVLRRLPNGLADVVDPEALDVTDALAEATTTLAVRSRGDHIVWVAASESVSADPTDRGELPVVTTTSRIDPATIVFGGPLDGPLWDVTARSRFDGYFNHRAVLCDTQAAVALINGTAAVAYGNNKGQLSIDLGQAKRSIVNSAHPDIENAQCSLAGTTLTFSIPLDGVAVHGRTVITGDVLMKRVSGQARERGIRGMITSLPVVGAYFRRGPGIHAARLVGDGSTAFVEGSLDVVPGEFLLVFRFPDRAVTTRIRVAFTRDRSYAFSLKG